MKKHLVFVDDCYNKVDVKFETENDYISLTGDYCNEAWGQIYDSIVPRTDLQKELVELWKEKQLKTPEDAVVERIATLMDKIQKENDEFYESLLSADEYPSIDDEEASINYLVDERGFYEDEAELIYAAIKANDYDLRVAPYIQTCNATNYTIVTIFGCDYNVCKDYMIDEIATNYLSDNPDFWQEAVASGRTYMGLDEWVEDAVATDGAMSVLAWSEVDTVEVDGTDYIVAVRD